MSTQQNTIEQQIVELKYRLSDTEKELASIQDEIDNFDVSDYFDESHYAEMLDDIYGEIEVCGYSYPASKVLESIDPTAYNCEYNDYIGTIDIETIKEYCELMQQKEELESEIEDIESELDSLNDELTDIEE